MTTEDWKHLAWACLAWGVLVLTGAAIILGAAYWNARGVAL